MKIFNNKSKRNVKVLSGVLSIAFLSIILFSGSGFNPPESSECIHSQSYDVVEESYFEYVGDIDFSQMSVADLLEAKHIVEVKTVENCVTEDDFVSTITLHNTEDIYEEWMPQVGKTVIDKNGVSIYNPSNDLLFEHDFSEELEYIHNENSSFLRTGIAPWPIFEMPSQNQIQELHDLGFEVFQPEEGIVTIYSDSTIITFNQNTLTIETEQIEDGVITYIEKENYGPNETGVNELIRRIQKRSRTASSGFCGNQVTISIFNNVKSDLKDEGRDRMKDGPTRLVEIEKLQQYAKEVNENEVMSFSVEKRDPEILVYPNPTMDHLTLMVTESTNSQVVYLELLDSSGRVLNDLGPHQTGANLKVNTTDLSPGLYFLRCKLSSGSRYSRFVKQ